MSGVAMFMIAVITHRATRLVQRDTILERPRTWVRDHVNLERPVATLLWCPWCLSVWIGTAVLAIWEVTVDVDVSWFERVAAVSFASTLTGLLLTAEPDED